MKNSDIAKAVVNKVKLGIQSRYASGYVVPVPKAIIVKTTKLIMGQLEEFNQSFHFLFSRPCHNYIFIYENMGIT
ncbi:hypothetical protein ACFLUP_03595 [Chloroflexota bacterium]